MRFLFTVLSFFGGTAALLALLYWGWNVGGLTVFLLGYILVMAFGVVSFHIAAVSGYDRGRQKHSSQRKRLGNTWGAGGKQWRDKQAEGSRDGAVALGDGKDSTAASDPDSDLILSRTCRILGVTMVAGGAMVIVTGTILAGMLLTVFGFALLILFRRSSRLVAGGKP